MCMQVLVYLIVSQCVESFPVIVDLSCDIFILQNDSGHSTLAPFFKNMGQRFRTKSTMQEVCAYVSFGFENILQ